MKLILKYIVFNKHFKYKRYNNKFLDYIVKFFLNKLFPEVLNISKPIVLKKKNNFNISKYGIKVYSQNEEDGIILYILQHIGIKTKKFVEIGIENGTECNTTNLLKNFNWSGLQIEGNRKLYLEAKNKLKKILGKKDVSMANADEVKANTGFSIGGVAPVAHIKKLDIIIDKSLSRFENIFAAAGHPNCVFKINYSQLIKITNGSEKEISE